VDYSKKSRTLIIFLITLLIFNCLAKVVLAEEEQQQKSFWDQIVEGWNNLVKSVSDTFTMIKDFLYDQLGKLWNFTQSVSRLLMEGAKATAETITKTFDLLVQFIGKWGEPELYFRIQTARLMYPDMNFTYVKDVAIILGDYDLMKDERVIDEIAPTGLLGFISFSVYALRGSSSIVQFILQNFVLIHLIIIISLLVWGFLGAIEKHDADYFIENCQRIVAIFSFYVKIIGWFIEKLIAFGHLVAQWLDTIIPF